MSSDTYHFTRSDLGEVTPIYTQITACIQGEQQVKKDGEKWLPKPNPTDTSAQNDARYDAYKTRAVFYNATGRTLSGMVGLLFYREPTVRVPSELEPLIRNTDGTGLDITQLSKALTNNVLAYGRAGLLTDYPSTEEETTVAQLESGLIRPTITQYAPWNVINWRTADIGAEAILSLVVLRESYDSSTDEFETEDGEQFRVLRLEREVDENGAVFGPLFYTVELIREDTEGGEVSRVKHIPLDASGSRLDRIPFTFVGSMNNDTCIDEAPLYPISSLNIAHYRNSADYEESSYQVGQPTPVFTNLTKDWVDDVLEGTVHMGSRAAIPLPEGSTAFLLQAAPNSMPKEAMDAKEKQMKSLGAKLITPATVERTATDALLEDSSEVSILTCSASNIEDAMEMALVWAAQFAGAADDDIDFMLDKDFHARVQSPEQRRQLVEEWTSGAITFGEMRDNLRKIGVAFMEDAEAQTVIAEEMEARNPIQDQTNDEEGSNEDTNNDA